MMLSGGESLPILQPYNTLAPKPHLRSAPLLEEEQKGLLLDPASISSLSHGSSHNSQ